ncbi:MAG: hypothetical protein AAGM67_01005, partial [Bacteroidota bacterium]
YQVTCQTQVANMLDITQGRVRHRFMRSIEKLKRAGEDFKEYVSLFEMTASSLNIRREVKRPSSEERYTCIVL